MTATRAPRLPLQPLLDAAGCVRPIDALRPLRLSGGAYRRLEADGLTDEQADRLAVRAGLHPGEVWPEWWELPPRLVWAAAG